MRKSRRIKEEKGITLVALIVTIIVLLLLSGITINALVGKNGIVTKARTAKKVYEDSTQKELTDLDILGEKFLSHSSEKYVTANGKLSVNKYGKLVNKDGKIVVLKGMSAGNGSGMDSLTDKYYNKEALSNIKSWGANVFRIPVDTDPYFKGYVGKNDTERKAMIDRVCDIADICIELDMYVIIDWHTLREYNPNNYLTEAKEFFTVIMEKYKDVPNVLYEICNEPTTHSWQAIKDYANEIIPVIRSKNNDAVIIVGTPEASQRIDVVIDDKLNYNNIIYTFHVYPNHMKSEYLEALDRVIQNNIPVFVTEWGAAPDFTLGGFFLETSNLITNYFKENDISWCNWNMTDKNEALSLVQPKKWDNSLRDEILSESGKYVKKLFQGVKMEDYPIMIDRVNKAFWASNCSENISTIIIEDQIDKDKIERAVESWDITNPIGVKKVMAYIEKDRKNSEKYILYIAGDGEVCCSPNSWNLFSYFTSLEKVDFTKLNTASVHHMGAMFAGDNRLKEINLENFDTKNVKQLDYMFADCTSLKAIDLSSFNTANVRQMNNMFANCTSLETVDLSSFDTSKVTNTSFMFKSVNSVQKIDFGNALFTKVTTSTDMFKEIKDNPVIIVKDEASKKFVQDRLAEVQKTAIIQIKGK